MGPVTAPCAEDPRADLLAGTKEIGSGASASAVPKTIVQKRPPPANFTCTTINYSSHGLQAPNDV